MIYARPYNSKLETQQAEILLSYLKAYPEAKCRSDIIRKKMNLKPYRLERLLALLRKNDYVIESITNWRGITWHILRPKLVPVNP